MTENHVKIRITVRIVRTFRARLAGTSAAVKSEEIVFLQIFWVSICAHNFEEARRSTFSIAHRMSTRACRTIDHVHACIWNKATNIVIVVLKLVNLNSAERVRGAVENTKTNASEGWLCGRYHVIACNIRVSCILWNLRVHSWYCLAAVKLQWCGQELNWFRYRQKP